MPSTGSAFLSEKVLPDEVQQRLERHELAASLEAQCVRFAKPWRATRTVLQTSGTVRFVLGEVVVVAPTVLVVLLALFHLRFLALLWVPFIGLAWWARTGAASCLGYAGSLIVPLVIGGLLLNVDQSGVTAFGAACVTWTWWVGVEVRKRQVDAILDRLANHPERYALLLANGSVQGPERADVGVVVRRSDQIDSG